MCRMSVTDQHARTHVHAQHDPDATVVQTLFRPPNLFGGTENHILRPHSITSGSDRTRARYLPPFSTARCTRTIASADPRQGPILWRMWCDVCGREWGKRPEHAGFGDPDEIRVDHEVKPEPNNDNPDRNLPNSLRTDGAARPGGRRLPIPRPEDAFQEGGHNPDADCNRQPGNPGPFYPQVPNPGTRPQWRRVRHSGVAERRRREGRTDRPPPRANTLLPRPPRSPGGHTRDEPAAEPPRVG